MDSDNSETSGSKTILLLEIDGREVPFSMRAHFEQQVFALKVLYQNTSNPLYVWKVIQLYLTPFPEIIRREADPCWELWSDVFPDWCLRYLQECASAVSSMDWGSDKPPSDCAASIPAEFGFTRKGWNAFNERREIRTSQWIDRFYFERRAEGVTAQQAMNETLERYGLENERSVRRRLSSLVRVCTPSNSGQELSQSQADKFGTAKTQCDQRGDNGGQDR